MLVVDASFVVQAALTGGALDRLKGWGAVAPPLLWSEVGSVLHELVWRGAISKELVETARKAVGRARIAMRRPARLHEEAWSVATQAGWAKTYDAEYVALARLLHCRLLTIDGRLARGAARFVEVVSPAELE